MLRSLYEKITDGYLTVITLRPHYTMKPFHVSELAEFSAYMLELSDQWDVYHNYNVMGAMPSGGRGKASDFNACAGTFLDFDLWQPDGKAHAANDKLPNNLNQVCDLLKEEDLPLPTYFVNSGNGAHGHFVFEEPETFATDVERALVQTQRKAFEQVYIDAFKKVGWKLDPMSDLPRITRAAGTKNHKRAGCMRRPASRGSARPKARRATSAATRGTRAS